MKTYLRECRKCGKFKRTMYFYQNHRVCKECMRAQPKKLPKGLVTL